MQQSAQNKSLLSISCRLDICDFAYECAYSIFCLCARTCICAAGSFVPRQQKDDERIVSVDELFPVSSVSSPAADNTRITASVSEKQFASRIKDVTQIHERGAFRFSPCSTFLSVDASAYTEHSRPSPLIPNNNFAYPAVPLLSDWAATDDWVYLIDSLFDQHRSPFSDFL